MFSEHVHAESFFITILDRLVKELLISNDIGEQKEENPPSYTPPKKTIKDIQRLFPLFTFSGLEVKANIHPKKNQSRHPSEGLYGCNYNLNSVFIASCLTWYPVKCMVQ